MKVTKEILRDVEQERINQMAKHYENLSLLHDFVVLSDNIGGVAKSLQTDQTWSRLSNEHDLYRGLVQVAAVAVKMAEKVKRDGTNRN